MVTVPDLLRPAVAWPPGFFALPNVPYLLASFVHLAGMAVWLGGIATLGAIVAPVLFRRLPRSEAGAHFAAMVARFERVALWAAVASVVGAAAKAAIGGQNPNLWALLRLASLGTMVALLSIGMLGVHPRLRRLLAERPSIGEASDADPARSEFQRLHRLSERLLSAQVVLGSIVLLLS